MCVICSRRSFVAGTAALLLKPRISMASNSVRVACVSATNDVKSNAGMSAKSDNPNFDNALIAELKRILRVIPVNPGFKYITADNAFSRDDTIVDGTQGTVLIGLTLVKKLLKSSEGGVSVACVLAHECSHVFQFFSKAQYYSRLAGPTERLRELHADLLAGYYMAKRNDFTATTLSIAQKTIIDLGTYNNTDPKDHGSPGQRNAALDRGYRYSLDGKSFQDAAREGEAYVRAL